MQARTWPADHQSSHLPTAISGRHCYTDTRKKEGFAPSTFTASGWKRNLGIPCTYKYSANTCRGEQLAHVIPQSTDISMNMGSVSRD